MLRITLLGVLLSTVNAFKEEILVPSDLSGNEELRVVDTDVSWVRVRLPGKLKLYFQQKSCYKCKWSKKNIFFDDEKLGYGEDLVEYEVEMQRPLRFQIFDEKDAMDLRWEDNNGICNEKFHKQFFSLKQGGYYEIVHDGDENSPPKSVDCNLVFINEEAYNEVAWKYFLPIWAAILTIFGIYVLHGLYKCVVKKRSSADVDSMEMNEIGKLPSAPEKKRLVSLDTFRGLSLAFMIFVNFGGADYWFFEHESWDGLTFADLMMPWFLFMAGVSIRFGIKSRLKRSPTKWHIVWEILVRGAKLSFLGIFIVTSSSEWSEVRLPGVLQRIAVGYCVVSILHLVSPHVKEDSKSLKTEAVFYWPEHVFAHFFLAVYCIVTYCLPVPDCPTGYTGPGGISENGEYEKCTGGAARYIDDLVFGKDHMYCHPTSEWGYQTSVCFDPEGLLGNLTSIYLTYMGLQAGKVFSMYPKFKDKKDFRGIMGHLAVGVLFYGIIGCLLATIGSKYENGELIERAVVPINKNLWSVSFVFVCGSLGYLMLMMLYVVCDYLSLWNGTPFYYAGRNSILIYLLHTICDGIPWDWKAEYDSHSEEMLMKCTNVTMWMIYAWWCHDRNFFVVV